MKAQPRSLLERALAAVRGPTKPVEPPAPALELSGPSWVSRFPTGRDTSSLVQPFRSHVQAFITALEAGGVYVRISATRRPAERAWLMRHSYDIVHGHIRPEDVPKHEGIPINWVHPTPEAGIEAAWAMVAAYELVARPSLSSLHISGEAIDMAIIGWQNRVVVNGQGQRVKLESAEDLYQCGASFGVYKLRSDPPHWSVNGH